MAIRQPSRQVINFSLQNNIMQLHWKGSIASKLVWWLFRVCSKWSSCNWVGCDYAAYEDLLITRRKKNFWLCKDHCTHTHEAWGFKWQLEMQQWGIFGFWTQLLNRLWTPHFEAWFKDTDKTSWQQAFVVYCRAEARFNLHTTSRWWAPI